jgi:hypothetical protein
MDPNSIRMLEVPCRMYHSPHNPPLVFGKIMLTHFPVDDPETLLFDSPACIHEAAAISSRIFHKLRLHDDLCYEKFFGSLLAGRDSNPDDHMSGMENRTTKPLFIV